MSRPLPESEAVVYCEGAFQTTYGKTAHGLVRRSERFRIRAVIDSTCAGRDAGEVLDGRAVGIPIVGTLRAALKVAEAAEVVLTDLLFGVAPDGGRLTEDQREDLLQAITLKLNVVAGLHDYLNEDPALVRAARRHRVTLVDARRPPPRADLHPFSGKIEEVDCLKVAILGTDSAIGKRTTAWRVVDALRDAGRPAEMIGTGQTAWLQGARYGTLLDALINDFVAGEIEHAVWSAWSEQRPDAVVIEGQGSLMNPAYPGGFEILAAGRPDGVILQHAPTRLEYDGLPGYPLHPIERQIEAIELLSERPVVAIALNHEGLEPGEIEGACDALRRRTGLPVHDPLVGAGAASLAEVLTERFAAKLPSRPEGDR